jgi:hypothetical protein
MVEIAINLVREVNCQSGQWRTHEFCFGGVQQIQLRTEGGENRDLGR